MDKEETQQTYLIYVRAMFKRNPLIGIIQV